MLILTTCNEVQTRYNYHLPKVQAWVKFAPRHLHCLLSKWGEWLMNFCIKDFKGRSIKHVFILFCWNSCIILLGLWQVWRGGCRNEWWGSDCVDPDRNGDLVKIRHTTHHHRQSGGQEEEGGSPLALGGWELLDLYLKVTVFSIGGGELLDLYPEVTQFTGWGVTRLYIRKLLSLRGGELLDFISWSYSV